MKKIVLLVALIAGCIVVYPQENYKTISRSDSTKCYNGSTFYSANTFEQTAVKKVPRNVILMIGDGMGISQISAALFANQGSLFLNNFRYCGYSQTQSADNFITDSSAGGTALSCGERTNNGYVAVDTKKCKLKTILEYAEGKGLKTGLVSTSSITHATPASFIAHQESRGSYEDIASDFLKTDIDLFIGGGYKHFTQRADGKNLIDSLTAKGYSVFTCLDSLEAKNNGKIACLTASEHNGRVSERKDMLPKATRLAVKNLANGDQGFFLMVEGSQIDMGGHQNDVQYIVEEMLDFDQSIGEALKFASANKETLIIVTADHETGGLALLGGNEKDGQVKAGFATGNHSGVLVPVFAYGPGANQFTGIMKNTDIFKKIYALLIDEKLSEN
ncbi:MAG TPA: alkaline phosphatase [Prolixibacteraceae bacterium]|nr:alkaline phosphatase [Prolixibacteraceae bacterium]